MTGRTNYTPITNSSAMLGPAQITDVYEHFDPLVGETVATASALPALGNWEGRTVFVQDVKRHRTWNGTNWNNRTSTLVTLATGYVNQSLNLTTTRAEGTVVLSGRVARTSGTGVIVGTVAAVADRPLEQVPFSLVAMNSGNTQGPFFSGYVDLDGTITITPLGGTWTTTTYIYFNITWLV